MGEAPDRDVPFDSAELINFTRRLVRIPSVFDEARKLNEGPAAECIGEQMRQFGWTPTFELVAPGRPNVFAVIEGDRPGPTLMFEGHSDVVTEGDHARWTHDPFGAVIEDGKMWGRGAADMKSGVAAMMFAADACVRAGSFPGRLIVAALADEEGMMSGAKDFVARGHLDQVDGVICCEPEGGEICHVAKGALRLRVDFHGVMAHGAMPFRGHNPNRAVGAAIAALAGLEDRLHQAHGDHEYLGKVWITPTVLRAGEPSQMNVMPADASIWLDVRTIPSVDHDGLIAEVAAVVAEAAGRHQISTEVTVIDNRPAVSTRRDHRLVRSLWEAHAAINGAPPTLGGVPGATDGTVLTSRTGVPSVVYGPGGKWIAHQANEFVEVAEIIQYCAVYADAARRFLGCSALYS